MPRRSVFLMSLFALALPLVLGGCQSPELAAQMVEIRQEPAGDYWVGRRFHLPGTRVWGYVRRPGKSWKTSRLVLMDENILRVPDRLPEEAERGLANGYDHNFEYHIVGEFLPRVGYDPNSDLEVPVFRPRSIKLVDSTPGFLFAPNDTYSQQTFPRWH